MYKLNKLQAQIKLLEHKLHKFELYELEVKALKVQDAKRISDIIRAQQKIKEQINMWTTKLSMVESQLARVPARDALTTAMGGPLIG